MNKFKQQGFLTILAVLFIVIIGFLGTTVAYLMASAAGSSNDYALSGAAFYLAESGLQKATRYLLTPVLSGTPARIACASLTGNANLTNYALGKGAVTVTTASGSPFYGNDTLSAAITSSVTTVTVTSTSGFAPSGRLKIDNEEMNYAAISGNSFIGVTRGVDNTTASTHASGAYVGQYQCSLVSTGGIPSVTAPLWKRTVNTNVELQEAWAVGNLSGSTFTTTHWNYPTELQWTSNAITNANRVNLTGMSLLSNAEGWAVGTANSTNFIYLHLTNGAFTVLTIAGACSGQTVNGVSAVSSAEAFSVGSVIRATACLSGKYRYGIQRWNGTTWVPLTSGTTPSIPADSNSALQNLNAISVINTNGGDTGNLGFAVGNSGTILQYNGTTWTSVSSSTSQALYGVYVVSASEAWAVGANGTVLKWNGSAWSTFTSPTTTTLNAIVMEDSNNNGIADGGFAVGNSGVAIIYNGSAWASQNTGLSNNLLGVSSFNANDAWAVGTSGVVVHWNGSAWATGTSNTSLQLNGISVVKFHSAAPTAGWSETFP